MPENLRFLKFINPSSGEVFFSQVISQVIDFMIAEPRMHYRVMIGSDSNGTSSLDVVSVVAIHRVGHGGRYFWTRNSVVGIKTLRQKIYAEVQASLDLATLFLPAFRAALEAQGSASEVPFDFQIHIDVGDQGETRSLVHEVTGMVRGYGYEVYVKPESAAATSVADRHVR